MQPFCPLLFKVIKCPICTLHCIRTHFIIPSRTNRVRKERKKWKRISFQIVPSVIVLKYRLEWKIWKRRADREKILIIQYRIFEVSLCDILRECCRVSRKSRMLNYLLQHKAEMILVQEVELVDIYDLQFSGYIFFLFENSMEAKVRWNLTILGVYWKIYYLLCLYKQLLNFWTFPGKLYCYVRAICYVEVYSFLNLLQFISGIVGDEDTSFTIYRPLKLQYIKRIFMYKFGIGIQTNVNLRGYVHLAVGKINMKFDILFPRDGDFQAFS